MNDLQIFNNDQFGQVRVIERDGEPWFIAADVCKALEIDRTATRRLDEDEKGVYSTHTPGGTQDVSIVNEPGLYALVLGSRKPEAKAFKRWITHDVIPAIRQHGAYMTPETIQQALGNPDFIIQLATQLKEAQAKSAALQQKIEADAPKVLFAESVTASESSMLIGEFAKILKQNGLDIGQNRLFHRLRSEGYLCSAHGDRYNSPTQKAMELGLFEIQEGTVLSPTGANIVTRTTRLSPKGQVYFINRYLKSNAVS